MRAGRLAIVATVLAALSTLEGTLIATPVRAQSTMNQLRLAEGADETNTLTSSVYDAGGTALVAIGAFTAAYDKKQLFVRRGGGNMFTRGPEYKLSPTIDVTALLTETVEAQARAMGLRIAGAGETGWQLSGTVRELYLESRQIPYGATLFYGYINVEVQVGSPSGAKETMVMRLHTYGGDYNAGGGRRDEAETAAARLLIEGAQELLASVNRAYIHARPSASMAAQLATLQAGRLRTQRATLRAIGLSGLDSATSTLLTLLPTEARESGRATVIDALALLGSVAAVEPLAQRYALEDEDCRWFTLKAMDYIGGEQAMKFVSTTGVADKDVGPKRLAARIAAKN